jgi:hypothetical protein
MKRDGVLDDNVAVEEAPPPLPTAPPATSERIYPLIEEPTDAIVVCCADNRFLGAIHDFLRDIGITNPVMVAVPGSVKAVSGFSGFIKDWHTLKGQLELLATRNKHVPRVVLFTHEECKSYAHSARIFGGIARIPQVQREHLVKLARILRKEYLPNAGFELYHAAIVPQGNRRGVRFQEIVSEKK